MENAAVLHSGLQKFPGTEAVCPGKVIFLTGLSVADNQIFGGAQLPQTQRAPGVELLGGDAHLTAKAELSAVGEAGGAVDVDGGTVHSRREEGGVGVGPGQDGFAVAGGVSRDVGDGFLHAVHDFHRKDVVEELGVEILRPGGNWYRRRLLQSSRSCIHG